VLWQRKATREKILEWNRSGAMAEFDVLHFATHAVIERGAPAWSRILLADDDLTTADVLDLNLNARLVTLSACASAVSAPGAGDELVGLTRAFFYAGTRAVVASLWQADDKTTGTLMQNFYAHLQRTASMADALRAAQLELRAAGVSPFYWAPFVIMGAA
jgi:CHAT domain-containing protein